MQPRANTARFQGTPEAVPVMLVRCPESLWRPAKRNHLSGASPRSAAKLADSLVRPALRDAIKMDNGIAFDDCGAVSTTVGVVVIQSRRTLAHRGIRDHAWVSGELSWRHRQTPVFPSSLQCRTNCWIQAGRRDRHPPPARTRRSRCDICRNTLPLGRSNGGVRMSGWQGRLPLEALLLHGLAIAQDDRSRPQVRADGRRQDASAGAGCGNGR